jgi:AcrR family transcriptional regulator
MVESRRTRYTRMVLRNSLMELMKSQSIEKISVKELCALADVSRSTFYAHYRDPCDLLHQIEDDVMAYCEKIRAKYDYKLDGRDIQKMIEEMLHYIHDNANTLQVLFSGHGNIEFQKKCFNFPLRGNMRKHLSQKMIDRKTYEYRLVFARIGSAAMIHHWLKNDTKRPISEIAKLIVEVNTLIL